MGVDVQLETVDAQRDIEYKFLLPGHGRPGIFKNTGDRNAYIDRLLKEEQFSPSQRLAAV